MLLCLGIRVFSQNLVIGPAEEIYSPGFLSRQSSGTGCNDTTADLRPWIDSDCGWYSEWVADGVVCHVKKDDSTLITFWPSPNRIQRYEGTLTDIRNTYDPVTAADTATYQWGVTSWQPTLNYYANAREYFSGLGKTAAIYLHNIYKTDEGGLIGFTHNEVFTGTVSVQRQYSIGIVYSSDMGDTWTFCGEIIKTKADSCNNDYNIHGVPYLVVGDEFYVYFREVVTGAGVNYSVAKAKIVDVIDAAKLGTVSAWEKWNGGSNWTNALGGDGVDVLSSRPLEWVNVNIHGDATRLTSTNNSPYVLVTSAIKYDTINSVWLDRSAILMFRSDDGLVWDPPEVVIEEAGQSCLVYPFILALQGGADDGHETSGSFYIYYHKNTLPLPPPATCEGLNFSTYRQRVSIDISPAINMLLLD